MRSFQLSRKEEEISLHILKFSNPTLADAPLDRDDGDSHQHLRYGRFPCNGGDLSELLAREHYGTELGGKIAQ